VNATTAGAAPRWNALSEAAYDVAVRAWFVTVVAGQAFFAYYIAAFHGGSAATGEWATWNHARNGHVDVIAGDAAGNLAAALHLLLAFVVTASGALQLVPQVRARAPAFHRWNGRLFLGAAFVASAAGLYLMWVRGTIGSTGQHLVASLNAVLVVVCGAMALRHAMAREIAEHRRWALRVFVLVSSTWFFRVLLMAWLVANRGPAGFDPKTFEGPAIDALMVSAYLLPLFLLELHGHAGDRAGPAARFALAAGLALITLVMAVGLFGAAKAMWLPRLRGGHPMVLVHIFTGLLAVSAGAIALAVSKGGPLHRRAGTAFVWTMLVMAGLGAGLAVLRSLEATAVALAHKFQGDSLGGFLSLYFVVTGLLTVRPSTGPTRGLEALATAGALVLVGVEFLWGFEALASVSGLRGGYPPFPFFLFGTVALLGVAGDLQVARAGRREGVSRIARHLWRMGIAMFIATSSLFLGQSQVLPDGLRVMPLLFAPVVLVLASVLYWFIRVHYRGSSALGAARSPS